MRVSGHHHRLHHPGHRAIPFDAEQNALTWFEQGVDLENKNQFTAAQASYEQALRQQPDLVEAHFNVANVLRALGQWPRAIWHYRQALAIDPGLACAWFNLADLLEARGDAVQAVRCLHRAIAADPGYADAHYNLALCYENLSEFEKAARHWKSYLRIDRASAWSRQAESFLNRCRAQIRS